MALQLCKSKHRSLGSPPLIHLFSTSENDYNGDNKDDNNNSNNSSNYSLNSYFSDVKASLRQQAPPKQTKSSPYSSSVPSKVASIEEIRKNLAEFRQRSAMPPPSTEPNPTAFPSQSHSHSHSQHVSFQEFFKKNEYNEAVSSKSSGKISLDTIRQSLRQMRAVNANNKNRGSMGNSEDRFSLKPFKDTFKMRSEIVDANRVIGGTQELPAAVFRKETSAEDKAAEQERMKTEFVKMYTVKEFGEKLRKLRPKGLEGGFSLQELNKRVMRLREMEVKESSLQFGGVVQALKESLHTLSMEGEHKAKAQRVKLLESFGGTPEYLQHPPKDHLVEKYFHPDNISSAEKIKIELAKVRDEFKMSESDCGSARVQIAQLTTKIKHLSSALHKKDKHSRKGLQAMVQRRKRLLKYLRRTDWDSYCFVLSKLGLRDNPDYKSLT